MNSRVVITRAAEQDIRHAVTWWRDHRSPEQAERWYNQIYPAIATLSQNPDRCPLSPEADLLSLPLRQLRFGIGRRATHRIVFTVSGQNIIVLRIRHVAQQDLDPGDLPTDQLP